jgi:methylase of polypeptide subunit release factors
VAISKLFVDNGWEVEILKDLAGRDRILIGRLAERAEDQQDEKEGSDG